MPPKFPKLIFSKPPLTDVYIWHSYVIFRAQKLSKVIAEEAGIPAEGNEGLRLGAAGAAVIITYNTKSDGRIDFDKLGWKNFMEGKNFVIGQPILIILRKTYDLSLELIIELHLI